MTKGSTTVVGIDLGDKRSKVTFLSSEGTVIRELKVATHRDAMRRALRGVPPCRVVMEACTDSAWVSHLVEELGHESVVANPRRLSLIYAEERKNDDRDAELLARVGRFDPSLLRPIRHRGLEAQADLARIRVRENLVDARTKLINATRSLVKTQGYRLPSCSTDSFHKKAAPAIPAVLTDALKPLVGSIAKLTDEIKAIDKELTRLAHTTYPKTRFLQQVAGVGPMTALTYVLTIEDPARFRQSRDVGPYLGLTPRQDQSGKSDRQLGITKAGNRYLRKLLTQCAHYVLGAFGPDTDLRRWGLALAERGGKNAKKRAVVAVARKLAVLLHRLWVDQSEYIPLRNEQQRQAA